MANERTSVTKATAAAKGTEIPLRIVVVAPPPGALFCVQGRPGEFLDPTRSKGADLAFDVTIRHAPERVGRAPRLLGRVVQGPPPQRFVYVCSGTCAGDVNTSLARRAKIPMVGITTALIAKAMRGGRLEARFAGTGRDGGPSCGTVPLLGRGWRIAR